MLILLYYDIKLKIDNYVENTVSVIIHYYHWFENKNN